MIEKAELQDLISLETRHLQLENEEIRETRAIFSSHILAILNSLSSHLPKKKHINVLSLACGVPDEYLALKVCLKQKGVSLNFVGIDIDPKTKKSCKKVFKNAGNNFTLLKGDITNHLQLERIMTYNGCLPTDGFDLIILRQPNIINLEKVFKPVLVTTIPYFSSIDARVFISTYHRVEIERTNEIVSPMRNYYSPGRANFCEMEGGGATIIDGETYIPDKFSFILSCEGNGMALHHSAPMRKTGTGQVSTEMGLRFFTNVAIPTTNREIDHQINAAASAPSAAP